jgi:hypothetical protein
MWIKRTTGNGCRVGNGSTIVPVAGVRDCVVIVFQRARIFTLASVAQLVDLNINGCNPKEFVAFDNRLGEGYHINVSSTSIKVWTGPISSCDPFEEEQTTRRSKPFYVRVCHITVIICTS